MKRKELSEKLFEEMKRIVTKYPNGVVEVPKMLYIKEFFPGGIGFTTCSNIEKEFEVLVFAHDFDSKNNYYKYKEDGSHENNSTLDNLEKMLQEIKGVCIEDCFLSNAIMGLRNSDKNTGEYAPFKDKNFLKLNEEFIRMQIEIIHPKLIITLGNDSLEIVKNALSIKLRNFGLVNSDKNIKSIEKNIIMDELKFDLIALTHTTNNRRQRNLSYRNYFKNDEILKGEQAEIEMMKDYFNNKYDLFIKEV